MIQTNLEPCRMMGGPFDGLVFRVEPGTVELWVPIPEPDPENWKDGVVRLFVIGGGADGLRLTSGKPQRDDKHSVYTWEPLPDLKYAETEEEAVDLEVEQFTMRAAALKALQEFIRA